MFIILLCNYKGGCGKSTSAVNIAACMAMKGHRVLIIDMDPQGAATSGLGINKKKIGTQMADVLVNEDLSLKEAIRPTEIKGLDIAPCNLDMAAVETLVGNSPGKDFILRDKLTELKASGDPYDFVIIDTPPYPGFFTVNSIVASDLMIIPVQCEYYAMEGMSQLQKLLNVIEKRYKAVPNIRVVLTMTTRTNLCSDVVAEVNEYFKEKVFSTQIPRTIKLAEAPAKGKPIYIHAPDSPGADAYKELTEEVLADVRTRTNSAQI
jgi:chromosome partitioning protein